MTDKFGAHSGVSIAYLVFMFGVGFGLIGVLLYAGANQWHFPGTVLVGGLAQLAFRITKRYWKNALSHQTTGNDDAPNGFSLTDFRDLVAGYAVLCIVSALWYSIGWGTRWLLG